MRSIKKYLIIISICIFLIFITSKSSLSITIEPININSCKLEQIMISDRSPNHNIQRLSINGEPVSSFGFFGQAPGTFDSPNGIIEYNNFIYVVDTNNHRIQKFSLNGSFISQFGGYGQGPGQFTNPWGIAIFNNTIYVVEEGNVYYPRIQILDLNGRYLSSFGNLGPGPGEFYLPRTIAIFNNTIYVADTGSHRIQKFSLNGSFISQFGEFGTGPGYLDSPEGLFIFNNSIYIVNAWNSRIQRFYLNGTYISGFGSYGATPGLFSYPSSIIVATEKIQHKACSITTPLYCKSRKLISNCRNCGCSCGTCSQNSECNINPDPYQTINNVSIYPNIAKIGDPITITIYTDKNCPYNSYPNIFDPVFIKIKDPLNREVGEIRLFDDGLHSDSLFADGIYSNIWDSSNATLLGNYSLDFIGNTRWDNQIYLRPNLSSFTIDDICVPIKEPDSTESNLNIIFIPCDYSDLNYFANDVKFFIEDFTNRVPYYTHTNKINFYRVDYPSLVCSHNPGENPYLPVDLVRSTADLCYTGYRKIVVLSNWSTANGVVFGLGSDIMYVTNPNPWAFYHEAGHSLPALDDEYNLFTNLQGLYPRAANCDIINYTSGIACPKWCSGPMIPYSGNSSCIGQQTQQACNDIPEGCFWLREPDPYYNNSRCVPVPNASQNIGAKCDNGTVCSRFCGHHWDWFKHEWPPDAMGWYNISEYGSIDIRETNIFMSNFGNIPQLIYQIYLRKINSKIEIEKVSVKTQIYVSQKFNDDYFIVLESDNGLTNNIPFSFNTQIVNEKFKNDAEGIISNDVKQITQDKLIVNIPYNKGIRSISITDKNNNIHFSRDINTLLK